MEIKILQNIMQPISYGIATYYSVTETHPSLCVIKNPSVYNKCGNINICFSNTDIHFKIFLSKLQEIVC